MIDNDMLQFALALLVTTCILRLCVRDHLAEWSIYAAAFAAVRCTACDAPVLRVAARFSTLELGFTIAFMQGVAAHVFVVFASVLEFPVFVWRAMCEYRALKRKVEYMHTLVGFALDDLELIELDAASFQRIKRTLLNALSE